MPNTDFLKLSSHEIFENLRETLPKGIAKTRDVLTVKDDVLYTWDFQDNCLITLNVKAVRQNESEPVKPQSLVTTSPPLFSPTSLIVNDSNTLVAAAATTGVLVIELPSRSAPYGQFENNKQLIYCRSHTLLESLAFNSSVEIRQVKFHIGSIQDTHILILTSNNNLKLYNIFNGNPSCVGTYSIGIQPMGCFPTTKTTFLEALGDTAVDFDFGLPEVKKSKVKRPLDSSKSLRFESPLEELTKLKIKDVQARTELDWPLYVLYKNGDIYVVYLELYEKAPALVKGPLQMFPKNQENYGEDSCSILCLQTTPGILCISNNKGTIHHALVLNSDDAEDDYISQMSTEERPTFIENPDRALYVFERVELQLGLSTSHEDFHYNCPVYLHVNQAKLGHYFATHETGVHSINIKCVETLHKFVDSNDEDFDSEIFSNNSTADYLLCTQINKPENTNPVIGFSLYYDTPSVLILLANGQFVSLALSSLFTLPIVDVSFENLENMTSPMKKVLSEPFDLKIQKILQLASTQPILKTAPKANYTQQECFDLLQNASQILRERFQNHTMARDEIEKRLKTLTKIKELQKKDILKMKEDQQILKESAEALAEKYEDIKDKQDEITKRCEKLLVLISRKKIEPSNAEKSYLDELKSSNKKIEIYAKAIKKLKERVKYQEIQMKNWLEQTQNEHKTVGNVQLDAIKTNLQDMTEKITNMITEVNQYKKQLNMK